MMKDGVTIEETLELPNGLKLILIFKRNKQENERMVTDSFNVKQLQNKNIVLFIWTFHNETW